MSKPWGGIGAWAAEAEREEAEEKERAAALAAVAPAASFPALKDSVKQPKKKKMTVTLSEFYATGGKDSSSRGLTPDEMMRLPTRPKERSEEEMQQGRLGGGFSSYGGGRRDADRRFDEDRRGSMQSRVSEFEPSRADGVGDWASGKKSFPIGDGGGRASRYGSVGGGFGGDAIGIGPSRADEVDNWGAGKKPTAPARSSTFGSGFRDFGAESGRWQRGGESFRENNGQERTRLVLEPRRVSNVNDVVTSNKPNPFGAARPREEVLAEKGLDWKKLDSEIEAKGVSRPTSSQSSRPNSAQSSRSENVSFDGGVEAVVKPKPKVNPFGDAKPREVLLEEKGKDWRKIDMQLERRVGRPDSEEESILKEEINRLKMELEKEPSSQETGPDGQNIQGVINQKEKELEQLARELDDKIRFGQKVSDRPGSGAGRAAGFSDRPGSGAGRAAGFSDRPGSGAGRAAGFSDRPRSRTGSVDEPKYTGFMDRPRSRGNADVWSRSGDDKQSFQGRRERGFSGNRDMDRKKTEGAW